MSDEGSSGRKIRSNRTFGPANAEGLMHLNACVGFNGGPHNLFDYASYFHLAADALVAIVTTRAGGEFATAIPTIMLDEAVYPAALCYRHAFETYLKAVIELARAQRGEDGAPTGHRLDKLTETALIEIDGCSFLDVTPDERALLRSLAEDCAEIDPTGETFRYPFTKGSRYILAGWSVINLPKMRERFHEGLSVLERFYNEREDAMHDGEAFVLPSSWFPSRTDGGDET